MNLQNTFLYANIGSQLVLIYAIGIGNFIVK